MRQLALRARVTRLTSLAARGEVGGGGGGGSSARVAQLALVHVGRVLGVVRWLGGRGIGGEFFGRWRRPTGVGALACRSGRDPTINMRWKGGG